MGSRVCGAHLGLIHVALKRVPGTTLPVDFKEHVAEAIEKAFTAVPAIELRK